MSRLCLFYMFKFFRNFNSRLQKFSSPESPDLITSLNFCFSGIITGMPFAAEHPVI